MNKIPGIPSSEITPEPVYLNRRKFMVGIGAAAGGAALAACAAPAGPVPAVAPTSAPAASPAPSGTASPAPGASEGALPDAGAPPVAGAATDELGDPLTGYDATVSYNNFYEFGTDKSDPARNAKQFRTEPWTLEVGGLVARPKTYGVDELVRKFGSEERIYRMRCVEAWSKVIPWLGFELGKLLKEVEPTGAAKYVRMETLYDPMQMPGQRSRWYQWPYVEGLRIDEAMNPLTIFSVGLYGKELLPQSGAPLRLVVPWKYGFKSIKSIVKLELVEEQPTSLWMAAAPEEYGFYANVNPEVDHPRWSQGSERRIGESGRRETLMFNGYEEQVAGMYAGMDLSANY